MYFQRLTRRVTRRVSTPSKPGYYPGYNPPAGNWFSNWWNSISFERPDEPPYDPPNDRDCEQNRDGCGELISDCVVWCSDDYGLGTHKYNKCMSRCVPKRCHGYHEWGQPPYSN